jgi:hypothetical protein
MAMFNFAPLAKETKGRSSSHSGRLALFRNVCPSPFSGTAVYVASKRVLYAVLFRSFMISSPGTAVGAAASARSVVEVASVDAVSTASPIAIGLLRRKISVLAQ